MWTSFKEGDSYSCIILMTEIILSSITYISQGTIYLSFHEVKRIHDVQKLHAWKKLHTFRILNVFFESLAILCNIKSLITSLMVC